MTNAVHHTEKVNMSFVRNKRPSGDLLLLGNVESWIFLPLWCMKHEPAFIFRTL